MKFNEQIPRQVVEELDKYIVGQAQAKRSVAIAPAQQMAQPSFAGRNAR